MRRQRYSTYDPGESELKHRRIHPVWSGIGCLLIVVVPIFCFLLADLLIDANIDQLPLPEQLMNTVNVFYLGEVENFNAKLVAAGVLTFGGYALLAFLYSLMYFASGQTMSGPMDAPPVRRRISTKGDRTRFK